MSSIFVTESLEDFFRVQVQQAIQNQGLRVLPETEYYLSHLLTEYTSIESFLQNNSTQFEREFLIKLMEQAWLAKGGAQKKIFRRLGDISLYVSGYFPESFAKKLVSSDYYSQMGGTAYSALSSQLSQESIRALFNELAEKFLNCVEILNEVSARHRSHSDINILKTYEQWLETNSRFAETLLREKGITLTNRNISIH